MADENQDGDLILSGIDIDYDESHPDDRHEIRAFVGELLWDPDRGDEERGKWILSFLDGKSHEIAVPRTDRVGAADAARRIVATRLVNWSD